MADLAGEVAAGLRGMGLAAPPGLAARLADYLGLLARWNRVHNLTAVRDPREMVSRHLLDSLSALPWVEGPALLDLGSGAGLPGIPLAMASPALRVVLLERSAKRAGFLRQCRLELELDNVSVEQARVQDYRPQPPFPCLIARAYAPLPRLLAEAGHCLAPGGRLVAMKGRIDEGELAGVPSGYDTEFVVPVTVPGTPGERHLVLLRKARERG